MSHFPLPSWCRDKIKYSLTEIMLIMKNDTENWKKLVYRKSNVVHRTTFQDPSS